MGLPTTLAGIAGFLIFVVLILGMSATDLFPDQTQGIRDNQAKFNVQLNATTNTTVTQSTDVWSSITNVFNFVTGVFNLVITFLAGIVQYSAFMVGVGSMLPPEFYVFFAIFASDAIIAIVLLLFIAGK